MRLRQLMGEEPPPTAMLQQGHWEERSLTAGTKRWSTGPQPYGENPLSRLPVRSEQLGSMFHVEHARSKL